MITIKGCQTLDGEDDGVELVTSGEFCAGDGVHRISYLESELTGMEGVRTEIELFGSDKVVLRRTGEFSSEMIFECGRRHICHYNTPAGMLQLTVATQGIENSMTERGGKLALHYSLEAMGQLFSRNDFFLDVKL